MALRGYYSESSTYETKQVDLNDFFSSSFDLESEFVNNSQEKKLAKKKKNKVEKKKKKKAEKPAKSHIFDHAFSR